MRDYLLEIALRKAGVIRSRVSEANLEPLRRVVEEYWKPHDPTELEPASYAAVDGSHNRVDFKGYTLYAVMGYGLARINDRVVEAPVGDVDLLLPPGVSERIQLYRETAEAIAAYKVSRSDLLMIDGSLKALLIHPRPLAGELALRSAINKAEERLGEDFFQEYWEGINKGLEEIRGESLVVDPFYSKKIIFTRGLLSSDDRGIIALLEYIEKLMVLRRVLEENIDEDKSRIVYISKTSRTMEYFKKAEIGEKDVVPVISDILLFSYFTKKPGYSKPLIIPLEEVKRLPDTGVLARIIRGFYDEIGIALTFARIIEGGPVFKLEIPVKIAGGGPSMEKLESIIHTFMNYMKGLEVNGYPYPLIEVDKASKITRGDMHTIAQSIGLLPQITGREVLEEWF